MAVLVDPRTGDKYELPDENVAAAQKQFGVVTPEAYAETQRQTQLQAESGGLGQELETAGSNFLREGAGFAGGFAASPGLPGAPPTLPVKPADVQNEIAPVTAEDAARNEANPIAAGLGKAAADLPAYAALAPIAAEAGTVAAGAAGLSSTVGAGAGLVTESAATGALQEAGEASEQGRPLDWWNVAKNSVINLALGAALPVAGAIYKKAFGGSALEQAVQSTIDRSGKAGQNLGAPEVNAAAAARNQSAIEETTAKLQSAVADSKAPVIKNLQAQRDGLLSLAENLREDSPDVAQSLEDAAALPGQRSYAALRDIASGEHSEDIATAIDNLTSDRALWGDKAVDHYQAVNAARDSGSSPSALLDAARDIDDSDVSSLVSELQDHVQEQGQISAASVFGEAHESTVGAAHEDFTNTDYEKARSELLNNDHDALTIVNESDAIYSQASQNSARQLDLLDNVMKNELSVGAKYDDWEIASKQWSPEKIAAQGQWVSKRVEQGDRLASAIEDLKSSNYDGKSYAADIVGTIRTYSKRLAEAESPLLRAQIAENLKRSADRFIGKLSRLPEQALETPIKTKLRDMIRPFADDLREGFQDAKLWGSKVAKYQAASNAAWKKLIDPLSRIQQTLTERTGFEWGEVGQAAFNRRAVAQRVEGLMRQNLGGGVNFQKDLAEALEGIGELVDAKEAHGITNRGRTKEALAALESIKDDQDLVSVVRVAEKNAEKHGHVTFAGASPGATLATQIGGHALDAVALHTLGLPVGRFVRSSEPGVARVLTKAVKGAKKGLGIAEKLPEFGSEGSAVRKVFEQHAHRYGRNLNDLNKTNAYATETFGQAPAYVALLKKYGRPAALGTGLATVAGVAGAAEDPDQQHAAYLAQAAADDTTATARALTDPAVAAEFSRRTANDPTTLELFQGEHSTIQQAFIEKRNAVQRMLRDPDAVIDALGDAFGGLSPALRDSLGAQAMKVATYLQSELPPQRGVSVTRPNGIPTSTLEARTYALKYTTALDPSTAFDDAKRGKLRHEQVATLQAVSPELYDDLKQQTLTEMGSGRSTIVQRQRADLLFGFGSALDPAFSPALSAAAAQGRLAKAQQSASQGSPVANKSNAALIPDGLKALTSQ